MSDHDAQIIVVHDIAVLNDNNYFYPTRKINPYPANVDNMVSSL
jgi:hypothetical protein